MKLTRNLPTQTRRDAWVEVNLDALEHNARRIRQFLPQDVQMMAIVKADAYGHGAVMCIPVLEASGVKMVGVASLDEALQIRQSGSEIGVLVIGPVPDWSIQTAIEHQIAVTVFAKEQLDSLKAVCQRYQKKLRVHIKVDTGMHRIGLDYQEAAAFIEACQALSCLQVEGVFTHLACSDNPRVNDLQFSRWQAVLSALHVKPPYLHMDNSAGMVLLPEAQCNLVRLGIALYGYLPESPEFSRDLRPVMGLKARIIRLMQVAPGEGVSYGHRFHTPPNEAPRLIATVPLGYADGIPRNLSGKIMARIRGVACPQVGTITMDQMMFDVSDVPDIEHGETLTLIGSEIGLKPAGMTLSDWAKILGTIEYELMCALRVRLPKVYTRNQ